MIKTRKHGSYIDIQWEFELPSFYAFRGHGLTAEQLKAECDAWGMKLDLTIPGEETYARWIPGDGDYDYYWHFSSPGRGAFKITVWHMDD